MADHQPDAAQDVFDIANWLERATSPARPPLAAAPAPPEYVPRHRADVPVDSVA
jgi:hypothetical protein